MYTLVDHLAGSAQTFETEGEAHAAAMELIAKHMQGPLAGNLGNSITISKMLYTSTLVNNSYRMVRPGVQIRPGAEIPTGSMNVEGLPADV